MKKQRINRKLVSLLLIVLLIGSGSVGCSGTKDHIVYEEQESNVPEETQLKGESTDSPIVTEEPSVELLPTEEPIEDDPTGDDLSVTEEPLPEETEDTTSQETTVNYDDESHKQVEYGDISFDLSSFHIVTETTAESYKKFHCELNTGESCERDEVDYSIEKIDSIDNKEAAEEYIKGRIGEYQALDTFDNIEDKSGITQMYEARTETGAYCVVICNGTTYYTTTTDIGMSYDMLDSSIDETTRKEIKNVPCGQGIESLVQSEISHRDLTGTYSITQNMDSTEYTANLSIDFNEEEYEYKYCFELSDGTGSQIQNLEWKTNFENYPEFMDLNQDGYLDLKIVIDNTPRYDINQLYIWDATKQSFEKVKSSETIGYFEVNDGYLKNWVNNKKGTYVCQKLVWDGISLVKESEEKSAPDGE